MAVRARLAQQLEPRLDWPWHAAKFRTVQASLFAKGDRRMEAETYLASGFGVRNALEAKRSGWTTFTSIADFWAPPRIKTVEVGPAHGVPYLNTSQVFDVRPTPRKFLAFGKTAKAEKRLAKQGTILVMASASPGRTTVVTKAHENSFISHHFMRVEPRDASKAGWVYAFLHSAQGQAMMRGSQYASIIRHIEPHHVAALPIPVVDKATEKRFAAKLLMVVSLRNEAFDLLLQAEARFSAAVGQLPVKQKEWGFVASAKAMAGGRRRLEASYYVPQATEIASQFEVSQRLSDLAERVWWMPRFKRFYGDGGLPYMSADELFTTNPPENKRILVDPDDGHEKYFVEPGWLLMACSGQVYGLNGAVALATEHHRRVFFSHDLIRIIPKKGVRAGYLMVALTHRTLGRPLLIRAAYGTSIPHLDPGDVADFPVVRLNERDENVIADLAEKSAAARADADALEREMAREASKLIDEFIKG